VIRAIRAAGGDAPDRRVDLAGANLAADPRGQRWGAKFACGIVFR